MADDHSPARSLSAKDAFFKHLAPGRECGGCVACCEFENIDVPALRKPAGVMCQHNTGGGCGIYETRPDCCRTWFCLWRRIEALPEEARPDKCGVAFEPMSDDPPSTPFERAYIMALAIETPDAFNRPVVKQALQVFANEGSLPIWAGYRDQKMLIYPVQEVADAVTDPAAPVPPGREDEVRRWRQRYGL